MGRTNEKTKPQTNQANHLVLYASSKRGLSNSKSQCNQFIKVLHFINYQFIKIPTISLFCVLICVGHEPLGGVRITEEIDNPVLIYAKITLPACPIPRNFLVGAS